MGKLTAVVIIFCGVLCMAIPITIVGNEFGIAWQVALIHVYGRQCTAYVHVHRLCMCTTSMSPDCVHTLRIAWQEREIFLVVRGVRKLLRERGLQPHEIVEVFNEFDTGLDGMLDAVEFSEALEVLGVRLPRTRMNQVFQLFDSDGDGYVDFAEFSERLFPGLDEDNPKKWSTASSSKLFARRSESLSRTSSYGEGWHQEQQQRQSSVAEPGACQGVTGPRLSEAPQVTGPARSSSSPVLGDPLSDERLKALLETANKASRALRLGRTSQGAAVDDARFVAIEGKVEGLLIASGKIEAQLALLCKHFQLSSVSVDAGGVVASDGEAEVFM